jgi:hypothetical protein
MNNQPSITLTADRPGEFFALHLVPVVLLQQGSCKVAYELRWGVFRWL